MTWFLPVALGYLAVTFLFATWLLRHEAERGRDAEGAEVLAACLLWLPVCVYVLATVVTWWLDERRRQ